MSQYNCCKWALLIILAFTYWLVFSFVCGFFSSKTLLFKTIKLLIGLTVTFVYVKIDFRSNNSIFLRFILTLSGIKEKNSTRLFQKWGSRNPEILTNFFKIITGAKFFLNCFIQTLKNNTNVVPKIFSKITNFPRNSFKTF